MHREYANVYSHKSFGKNWYYVSQSIDFFPDKWFSTVLILLKLLKQQQFISITSNIYSLSMTDIFFIKYVAIILRMLRTNGKNVVLNLIMKRWWLNEPVLSI